MAQKVFWRGTFVDTNGNPATNFYIQAMDHNAPSTTLTIYMDADGTDALDDDIAEADQYGIISFFGEGTYDLRVFERAGVLPAPLSDNLIETYLEVRFIDPLKAWDEDDEDLPQTLPYTHRQLETAVFGAQSILNGVPEVEDGYAIYQIEGGTPGSEITSISNVGDFANTTGRVIVLYFKEYYQYKNGGNMLLDGDFHTQDGATLTLVKMDAMWVEISRSNNVDITADAANYSSPVMVTAGAAITVPEPSPVIVVDPDGQLELENMYWIDGSDDPPPGTMITLLFSDEILVVDGLGFLMNGNFAAQSDATITFVSAVYTGGVVKWFEVARSNNGYSYTGQWLDLTNNPPISMEVDTYYIAGSAIEMDPPPSIETLVGGYEGMRIRLICRLPIITPPGDDEGDYSPGMREITRKLVHGDRENPGAGALVLYGGDDFSMLPNEAIEFVRVDLPGGGGTEYWWNEVSRTERYDLMPELVLEDGGTIPIWRHQHILENGSPDELTVGLPTVRNPGYVVEFHCNGTLKLVFNTVTGYTQPSSDLRLELPGDVHRYVATATGWCWIGGAGGS